MNAEGRPLGSDWSSNKFLPQGWLFRLVNIISGRQSCNRFSLRIVRGGELEVKVTARTGFPAPKSPLRSYRGVIRSMVESEVAFSDEEFNLVSQFPCGKKRVVGLFSAGILSLNK